MAKKKEPTQLERVVEKLLELAPNVTAQDIKEAAHEIDVSTVTVSRYLAGGPSLILDTAIKLLPILQKKVKAREEILK